MSFAALVILLIAALWLIVLVRAAVIGNWWIVALYAGMAAGLADLLFVLTVGGDAPEVSWIRPWSGIAFVGALLALLSKRPRAVRSVGMTALLIGAAWAYVALRELLGTSEVEWLELVWWAGLVAVHLMTFDASRRFTSGSSRPRYGEAFD